MDSEVWKWMIAVSDVIVVGYRLSAPNPLDPRAIEEDVLDVKASTMVYFKV